MANKAKYRLLRVGEKLRPTDQVLIVCNGKWWRLGKDHKGEKIQDGTRGSFPVGFYRRKVKK